MKFKCVQTFSPEYLQQCRTMTADEILRFLDDFSQLHSASLNLVSKELKTVDPKDSGEINRDES